MAQFNTKEDHTSIKLKALSLVQSDFELFGAIPRLAEEIKARARYHIEQMRAALPTPQTVLTDNEERFREMFTKQYLITYEGLYAAHTGLIPFRDSVEPPRYTASAAFEDEGDEPQFLGLPGLLAIISKEQDTLRQNALADSVAPEEYLFDLVQVNIADSQETDVYAPRVFVCYELADKEIISIHTQEVSDALLLGLGLPTADILHPITKKEDDEH